METMVFRANRWRYLIHFYIGWIVAQCIVWLRTDSFNVGGLIGGCIGILIAASLISERKYDMSLSEKYLSGMRLRRGLFYRTATIDLADLDIENSRCSRFRGSYIRCKNGRKLVVQSAMFSHRRTQELFNELNKRISQPEVGQVSSEAAPSASPDEPST